jgi:hypothetical protein
LPAFQDAPRHPLKGAEEDDKRIDAILAKRKFRS